MNKIKKIVDTLFKLCYNYCVVYFLWGVVYKLFKRVNYWCNVNITNI